ncbi:hypothetical protein GWN26_05740 [Candidatus Saccharibacteria bacterium]|nr:hypothetical protein [Calditrichia bacterium]NIV98662.1 hypothetical protein [Candidatus Saccharibacteria bacterium]NIW78912.1 hypothetical protein [Calditrichia bacterium]
MKDRFGEAERVEKIKGWNLPTPDNRRKIYGNGFLLVGDAAGLVNPLTGGGIDNAMHSGKVAAECSAEICRGSDYSEKRLSNYASRLWKELGENQFKSEYRLQRLGSLRAFHSLFNLLVSQVNAKPELSNCIRFLVVDGKPANNRKLMTLLLRNLV